MDDQHCRLPVAASALDMKLIQEVMPVGASQSILSEQRCLAEGTPVTDMTFKVQRTKSGQLLAMPDSNNLIAFDDFDGPWAEVAATWHFDVNASGLSPSCVAPPGTESSLEIHFGTDGVSDKIELGHLDLELHPQHQYRLSFSLKTIGLEPLDDKRSFGFYARVSSESTPGTFLGLERANHSIEATQDWRTYSVILNSYAFSSGQFWMGFSNLNAGYVYVTNVRLQEIGGANLIQRNDDPQTAGIDEGLPIRVTLKSTGHRLRENVDYEPWHDELVKRMEWFVHEHSGTPLRIKNPDLEGQELSVNYYHASLPDDDVGYVCCSLRHPRVLKLFRNQVAGINTIVNPNRWLINHDEIRGMGHDPLSESDSPAAILMENLQKCTGIIQTINPNAGIAVFNDMYDPHHNAVRRDEVNSSGDRLSYYPMVNGEFYNSWNDMDKKLTILNWQMAGLPPTVTVLGEWKDSLTHFENCVQVPQVVNGFYDVTTGDEAGVKERAGKQFSLAKGFQKITAVCYYSIKRDHRFIKQFSKSADEIWNNSP